MFHKQGTSIEPPIYDGSCHGAPKKDALTVRFIKERNSESKKGTTGLPRSRGAAKKPLGKHAPVKRDLVKRVPIRSSFIPMPLLFAVSLFHRYTGSCNKLCRLSPACSLCFLFSCSLCFLFSSFILLCFFLHSLSFAETASNSFTPGSTMT